MLKGGGGGGGGGGGVPGVGRWFAALCVFVLLTVFVVQSGVRICFSPLTGELFLHLTASFLHTGWINF